MSMGFMDMVRAVMAKARTAGKTAPSDGDGSITAEPDHTADLPPAENRLTDSVEGHHTTEAPEEFCAPVGPPPRYIDRRAFASKKHDYGQRDWSKVTGICLHQTACVLGERPGRWDAIGCHVGVTRSGQVMHLHNFNRLIVHGNGWNSQTVGIEIDGMYAGIEGNDRTFWRPKDEPNRQPQKLTAETIAATRQMIRWICDQVADHGGKIKVLVAHRQASENRQSDPGSAIWKDIALPMMDELNLSDGGHGFKIGTGYAIPEAWDPRKKGIKY
jgi:hypothetical protein